MDTIQSLFDEYLKSLFAEAESDEQIEVLGASMSERTLRFVHETAARILPEIKAAAFPSGIEARRASHQEFVLSNGRKWKDAFDLLELFVEVCQEAGSSFNTRVRPRAAADNDVVFNVLVQIHARACLVSSEIFTLLVNGFADGAHGRWRALHELTVTSLFIGKHGPSTAEKFLWHQCVDAYKGASQHKRYAERLNAAPASDEQIAVLRDRFEAALSRYGPNFENAYGWAACEVGKRNPNFADLEADINMEHWRPYYKWASQSIHAGANSLRPSLGLADVKEEVLLIGPSDAGMTDPAHMMSVSLSQCTAALLQHSPLMDDVVALRIIETLVEEVGETFMRCNRPLSTSAA